MQPKSTTENTGRLCSIYCPTCKKTTTKISFNLLREAGSAEVLCPYCREPTFLEYDGKTVTIWYTQWTVTMEQKEPSILD